MNKKLFLLILIPALLIIGAYLFIRFSLQSSIDKEEKTSASLKSGQDTGKLKQASPLDLRPLFIKKLQQLVTKSSNGLYHLSVDDLKVDVLASAISLADVSITPDKDVIASLLKNAQAPNDIFTLSFKSLLIEGVNIDDAITSKTMDYKLIKIIAPVIEVHHKNRTASKKNDEDFSQRFLKEMQKLSVNKLVIEGATVIHYNDDQKGKKTKLNDFSLTMNNILIDSATRTAKDRFLFAKEAFLSFKNFNTATNNGLYNFKVGSVAVKEPQHTVRLQNITYKSSLSKAAFQKKFKTRKEIFNLSMPSVTIQNMDWWDLMNEEKLEAGDITITNLKLAVYLDRTPPPSSKMGNFPNQMLMKMPMKIRIKKIGVHNMEVTYTELNPKSAQSGTVELDKINMNISNVTNIKALLAANATTKITATARFMRAVPLEAAFNLDMVNYKSGAFTANLSVDGFDGKLANSFAGPLGLVKIKDGTIQKVEVKVKGNERKATSDVLLLYKDLNVSLLEKDSDKKALDKKDVTSFLANLLLIKNDNPKGNKEPRREKGEFIRNPNAGFLNLVWKAALTGILKTIGAPAKLAYKQ